MNVGSVILLGIIALVASAGAVVAGANAALAIPAAAVAVGSSALLFLSVFDRLAWPASRVGTPSRAPATRVREAIAAGKHGRRELIAFLDSLERSGFGLATPVLPAEELGHLLSASPEEFRRYLESRVRELERRT
ncbi:MAG TPA: hypothetical protein VEG66_08870 [Thermoplasmata archaeon]|nr:hypothetical protein [Thermoplasmata archaeon]